MTMDASLLNGSGSSEDSGNAIEGMVVALPLIVGFWGAIATAVVAVCGAGAATAITGAATVGAAGGAVLLTRRRWRRVIADYRQARAL